MIASERLHFVSDLRSELFLHIMNEKKIPYKPRGGGAIINKWSTRHSHIDNHGLDCLCYALANAMFRQFYHINSQEEFDNLYGEKEYYPKIYT